MEKYTGYMYLGSVKVHLYGILLNANNIDYSIKGEYGSDRDYFNEAPGLMVEYIKEGLFLKLKGTFEKQLLIPKDQIKVLNLRNLKKKEDKFSKEKITAIEKHLF